MTVVLSLRMAGDLVERLAAIGSAICALELFFWPIPLRDDGLMTWRVNQLRHASLFAGFMGRVLNLLFAYPAIRVLMAVQALCALLLAVGVGNGRGTSFLIYAVTFCLAAQMIRSPQGLDGADQLYLIIFVTRSLAHLCPDPWVQRACLWFLAGQVCLSYATAGLAKSISRGWWSGVHLAGIFGTQMYGCEPIAVLLRKHMSWSAWLSRFVILFECLFPLVLFVPPPASYVILAAGLGFHVATAFTMGLNTFFWASSRPTPRSSAVSANKTSESK